MLTVTDEVSVHTNDGLVSFKVSSFGEIGLWFSETESWEYDQIDRDTSPEDVLLRYREMIDKQIIKLRGE